MSGERGLFSCSKYSPAAAAAAALLSFCILLSLQLFGDPQLLRAFLSGTSGKQELVSSSHGTIAPFGAEEAGPLHVYMPADTNVGQAGGLSKFLGKAAPAPAAAGNATLAAADAVLEMILGTEVVYTRVAAPKAVLLLFHGCSHSAKDWGFASASCPGCMGLPEEARIVRTGRKFGAVPVAFSSAERESRCWDGQWLDKSRDIAAVKAAWNVLAAREGWDKLPVYALGASSGAAMVLSLALRMPLDGIVPQIMSLPPHMLEMKPEDAAAGSSGKTWMYPPTYFVHMELDKANAERVTANIDVLKTKQGAWVTERKLRSRPITASYFSDRVDGVTTAASKAIYQALKDAKLLNATDYLIEDPRQDAPVWQKALKRLPDLAGVSLEAEKSPIFEELNLAWARHELISDGLEEVLEWLDAKRRDGSAKLMAAVKPRRQLSL